jgi:hypothetical protein
MKLLIIILIFLPLNLFAQNGTDSVNTKPVVPRSVNECVNEVSRNNDAIKLLLTDITADKNKLKEVVSEITNDPDMKDVLTKLRNAIIRIKE